MSFFHPINVKDAFNWKNYLKRNSIGLKRNKEKKGSKGKNL